VDLSELNSLDFRNMGGWPAPAKAVVFLLLFAALVTAGWYFDWKEQWISLEREQAKEETLKTDFEKKQLRAANLDLFKEQLAQMEAAFGEMLGQLPATLEVEEFVVDVSQTALSAGLELELIRPGAESSKDFYAEYPVTIRVVGTYHQMGKFVSGIAGLPRIVTLHNITLKPAGKNRADLLVMDATAKTYRYLTQGN
jgi:type IV pilus assembly protein PilO